MKRNDSVAYTERQSFVWQLGKLKILVYLLFAR